MPAEEYVDFNACSPGFFINSNQVDWKQASLQAIIEKHVYCEKSSNCDEGKDGIGAIEMICDKDESPLEISNHEALGMLDQLLPVSVISKIDCTVLVTITEKVNTLVINHKKQTSFKYLFSLNI